YIDAFCEEGYFTVDQTLRIVKAGMAYGLKPKVHVNQFTSLGSVEPLVNMGALSLDHLEEMSEADYAAMENKNTLAVGLPGCSFFLGIPYTPVKQMMERNIPIALASDFNPGSTPCGNMNTIHMLACTQMKLTPEQAINAATVNAACAMESHPTEGAIGVGQKANLIFFAPRVKTLSYLSYSFGDNLVDKVMVAGEMV
ncbi:MAG: imidazolonepropionase, partial [Luteibaculaceae bacterium]